MENMQTMDYYEKELQKEQETVRNRILTSMKDIEAGKGREYNEFFDEVEEKYLQG